ncbi:MAG: DMT family transporter [Deltaproteobacteria bacterium]
MRTALFAAAAMLGFAANSLLGRAALRTDQIDATSFTAIRLATGALVLALLVAGRRDRLRGAGSWGSAIALAGYAVAFTFAYRVLPAGTGALVLFGAVQLTMIVGGLLRGERPTLLQWIGWTCALAGLVVITAPGLDPPPLTGTLLMLAAGAAWGVYSLRGRGIARPLATTADNFLRTLPIAAVLFFVGARHMTTMGVVLAACSGGIASGLGYSLWYAAVPALGATRSAAVQLSVPVITALAALALFDEPLRPTLIAGGAAILVGLALALSSRRSR